MKILKGRIWISIIAVMILVLLGWTVWQNVRAYLPMNMTQRFTVPVEGEYSIDGGEWQTIDIEKPIDEHFHKAVFKGNLIKNLKFNRIMDIVSKNVWYNIYDADGNFIDGYDRRSEEVPEEILVPGE